MREIQRISVTDTVVEELKEMIETEQLKPGEKLPTEGEMCESMKVSRTCVREAVRVLQALGMVEIRPGKGSFVADNPIDTRDKWYEITGLSIGDFIEVRMAIEIVATKLAIERATEDQVDKLEKILKQFIKANEMHNSSDMVKFDEAFHTEIVKIAGNPLLIKLNKQVLLVSRTYRYHSFYDEDVYDNAIVPHKNIFECFKKRDASLGQSEMQKHMEITWKDMVYMQNKNQERK